MKKCKKTAYLISECPYAGILKAMIENAKLLVNMGFDVVFIFPEKARDRYGERIENNTKILQGIGNIEYIQMTKKYSSILRNCIGLNNFLKKQSIKKTIFFSYGSYAGKISRILYLLNKIDILYHVPQCIDLERMSIRYKLMEVCLERFLSSCTLGYVACSPSEVYRLNYYFGVPMEKIALIPNSISSNREQSSEKRKRYTFIYVGRMIRSKGVYDILDAIKGIGFLRELIVLGDGSELENLKDKYPEATFLGNVSNQEVFRYLKMSKFIINNSCIEGLSFSLIEAMALGVIPMVSQVDGNEDIIINSHNGFIFSDKASLIKVLFKGMLLDSKQRSKMSLAAMHTAFELRRIGVKSFVRLISLSI